MINRLIDFALEHRLLTVLLVLLLSTWGVAAYFKLPKDIYPDLNAPLVTVITDNPGMPAEDVERLISFPLESLVSGAPHVTRVRSESATGDSVVTVEFEWGTDIYLARQIVSSKLELVAGRLPLGTSTPILGPVSSRMGEVFEFAVIGDGADPMELRSVADWTIRYRLQGVPGAAFIINLGGFVRQFQVFLKPDMLRNYSITVAQVKEAIAKSNRNFAGGIILKGPQEVLVKGLGRIDTLEHLNNTVITARRSRRPPHSAIGGGGHRAQRRASDCLPGEPHAVEDHPVQHRRARHRRFRGRSPAENRTGRSHAPGIPRKLRRSI